MARKTRLHFPGACYHVILRGNAGHDIFFDTQDRGRFFLLLQEGLEKFQHRIHAYCLMLIPFVRQWLKHRKNILGAAIRLISERLRSLG